jgi:hypothetical protein
VSGNVFKSKRESIPFQLKSNAASASCWMNATDEELCVCVTAENRTQGIVTGKRTADNPPTVPWTQHFQLTPAIGPRIRLFFVQLPVAYCMGFGGFTSSYYMGMISGPPIQQGAH